MRRTLRKLAIYTAALVLGVALFVLLFVVAIQVVGLSSAEARGLAFVALLAYALVVAYLVETRSRR
jgi:hypothetical protein